jgi:hypothetical protein
MGMCPGAPPSRHGTDVEEDPEVSSHHLFGFTTQAKKNSLAVQSKMSLKSFS